MIFSFLQLHNTILAFYRSSWRRIVSSCLLTLIGAFSCFFLIGASPALAGINDDHFDGNIFALYGGNGSLVPPRVTLADSFNRSKPAILVFYVDDSSDCKQFAIVVSRMQAFYGRSADLIPVNVDAIPLKATYAPTEPGYYYDGAVPQIVVLNQKSEVVLNHKGKVAYEKVDDVLREVFDLLPREITPDLKQRSFNEFSSELAK